MNRGAPAVQEGQLARPLYLKKREVRTALRVSRSSVHMDFAERRMAPMDPLRLMILIVNPLDIRQRCPVPLQLVIDRTVLLVDGLLLLCHYDPIQAKRFTCSANVLATRSRSNGHA